MARKSKKQRLTIVHPRCAGIDIGSREHWVAVDPERLRSPVRCFTTFTDDLHRLADWLKSLEWTWLPWRLPACIGSPV